MCHNRFAPEKEGEGGITFEIRIGFESENFIVRPGGKNQSSDQIDSQKFQFSPLKSQCWKNALDKSFKNKNSLLIFYCTLGAYTTVNGSKGSEKTLTWKFHHPQDEITFWNSRELFKMKFRYMVDHSRHRRRGGPWDPYTKMEDILVFENLQNIFGKEAKKAAEIMDTHFKDWNVDE